MKTKKWLSVLGGILMALTVSGVSSVEAADKIQYFGRWEHESEVHRCGYGATYLKATFTGTSLRADLTGKNIWWRVFIDGEDVGRLQGKGKDTVLAENLSPGMHTVLITRLTEGAVGKSEFRGFKLDEYHGLLQSEPPKLRRLEFVGDSISAGAMNDGKYIPEKGNYYDVGDNEHAYGPILARMLDADYSVIATSGQGIAHNYSEQPPYNAVHAADSYEWTFYNDRFDDKNILWDARNFPVDAVIISMGTNDFTDQEHLTAAEFQAGYYRLLTNIRRMNPSKPIICLEPLPSWIGSDGRRWIEETTQKFIADGNEKIFYIPVNVPQPLLASEDYVDGETHPTKHGSFLFAKFLKNKIADILGWQ